MLTIEKTSNSYIDHLPSLEVTMGNGSIFNYNLLIEHYSPRIHAYYFKQWSDFHMAFHQHDSTEIMYVIQGDCMVEWGEVHPSGKR